MGCSLLNGEEFSSQTFKKIQCPGERLEAKEFYECQFIDGVFTEATFDRCRFIDCTFQGCDLSLARVPGCTFRGVTFEKSKLVGIDWTQAVWGRKQGLLNSAAFVECTLNYSTFIATEMPRLRLTKCVARDVDFAEATLTSADFTGTDLTDSRFWQTDLTEADFTGASGYAISATLNTLKKTKFSLPEAISLLYSLDIVLSGDEDRV
ncbi:pentapeptide repeat-containing protein [Aggregatilinea lenta]|uniref:pentapeptide repeat-containing protein n=1 Tax=Aggregatilinea lenta TaxID=913108 RepID=UPI000E5B7738|nr:pentapeptide repeat-containing protein [Aggregatilinea lenta]